MTLNLDAWEQLAMSASVRCRCAAARDVFYNWYRAGSDIVAGDYARGASPTGAAAARRSASKHGGRVHPGRAVIATLAQLRPRPPSVGYDELMTVLERTR